MAGVYIKEVAKISNGLNVRLCCGERGNSGGATPDHIWIVLSGGRSRNITARGEGEVWGVNVTVFPPLVFRPVC